ncbi:MAG: hypothetical protein ACLP5H_18240 [Desulfomonilaceae bacterium]
MDKGIACSAVDPTGYFQVKSAFPASLPVRVVEALGPVFMIRCSLLTMGVGTTHSTGHWHNMAEAAEARGRWTGKA